MADAKKAKTSTFAQRKASRECLERVGPVLLKYLREGFSIQKSCKKANVGRAKVSRWLNIAEHNPDAPESLIQFALDFNQAIADGENARDAMEVQGKLKGKLKTGAVIDIGKIIGLETMVEIERSVDLGKIAEKRQAQADLDEQEDNEDEDAWMTKVKSRANEHGKDDNSL